MYCSHFGSKQVILPTQKNTEMFWSRNGFEKRAKFKRVGLANFFYFIFDNR